MVVAPVDALAGQDALPMPTPLAWVEAPLADRVCLLRQGVPAINRKLNQNLRLSPDEQNG